MKIDNKGNGQPDVMDERIRRTSRSVPLIDLPRGWKAKSDHEKVMYMHRLASSYNDTCQKIQNERNDLARKLNDMELRLTAAINSRTKDQVMIHNRLALADAEKQKLLIENQELHREIKALEDELSGCKRRLGE